MSKDSAASDYRDWAANAKSRLEKKRQDNRLSSAAFVKEQELIAARAPEVWAFIRNQMKGMCEAFNAEMGEDVLLWSSAKSNEAVIRIKDTGQEAKAVFDTKGFGINLESVNMIESFNPCIYNSEVIYKSHKGVTQAHEIARRLIDPLVSLIS